MRDWWKRRTLRFRLAAWYGVGGTLLLAVFSATLYIYVAEKMAQPLGQVLREDLQVVEANLKIVSPTQILWKNRPVGPRAQWTTEYPWFELWDENGKLVRRLWPFAENRT